MVIAVNPFHPDQIIRVCIGYLYKICISGALVLKIQNQF